MSEEKKPDVKEEVTLEDLQKQIEELKAENDSLKADAEKVKKTISNANADAAAWKDKYRSTLDESKRKEEEQAEAAKALNDELVALRAEKRISTYTAKLMEVGYDAQTASVMAAGLPEGISEDFFNQQKSFIETQKQNAKTEAINNQPKLTIGETPSSPKDGEDSNIRRWMGL